MPTLRAVKFSGVGAAPSNPSLRAVRFTGSGTAAVVVNPIATQDNIEPASTVTVTASLVGGGAADTWTWRRVSGPAIGITASTNTATFTAPSDINGVSVVVGVTATVSGVASLEQTCTVNVLPQTEWWSDGAGGWIPNVIIWAP